MRLEFLLSPCLQTFYFAVDADPFDEEIEGVLAYPVAPVIVVLITIARFTVQSLRFILGTRCFLGRILHTDHR
jgi:hypothetical protein